MITERLANPELAEFEVGGHTRASFLMRGALAAGAVYGTTAVAPFISNALGATTDVDILNFALTLEYLETDFYQVKAKTVGLTGQAKHDAANFGMEEAAHVAALTSAIKKSGGTPVPKPKFVFPVSSAAEFLGLAYTVENLGVSAYNGAGPLLKSKDLLAAAGSIVQIEARHAAAIGLLIGKSPTPSGGFDSPKTMKQVLAAAKPLIK
ncbi:MAG TPA: ferritin-like domain-containing protein [Solirubrobacteraceae bacterium]